MGEFSVAKAFATDNFFLGNWEVTSSPNPKDREREGAEGKTFLNFLIENVKKGGFEKEKHKETYIDQRVADNLLFKKV
jgi:hypothetical protein